MESLETTTTTWIIIATALVWLIWDIYLYVTNKPTISVKMRQWGENIMAIVFILGFLMGHWFW